MGPSLEDDFEVILPAAFVAAPEAPSECVRPKVGIVVTTWNRPDYLERMWRSLAQSQLPDAVVIIVDDASDDLETRSLVRALRLPRTPVARLLRRRHTGPNPHDGVRAGWDLACRLGVDVLVNLDADMVVRPQWLATVTRLLESATGRVAPEVIVTGFNAHLHKRLAQFRDHYRKGSIGGANVVVRRETYQGWLRDAFFDQGWDWNMVRAAQARGCPLLATRPSVVQHIGFTGLWSHPLHADWAVDYTESSVLAPALRLLAQVQRAYVCAYLRLKAVVRPPS